MNIYQALKQVPHKKRLYFQWKFGLNFDQSKQQKSEEQFLKIVGAKTMNGFKAWEKSDEYKNLLALYLNSRVDDDFYQVYEKVAEKALKGDEKYIKLLIQLRREIKDFAKVAERQLSAVKIEEDDLIL